MAGSLAKSLLVILLVTRISSLTNGASTVDRPVPILIVDDDGNDRETPNPFTLVEENATPATIILNDDDETPGTIISNEEQSFENLNPTHVNGEELFESDIMLTPEQRAAMAERKAVFSSLDYRWVTGSDGYPHVPYIFGDNDVDRTAVQAGIDHWEEHTCIKFDTATDLTAPHLRFIKKPGCWSYIGRIWDWEGQDISIGSGCTRLGTVVHEIGHAMGFFHEQSRSDRDTYVYINTENIKDGRERNFRKVPDADVSNYSVPYDYTSDMHYGGTYFTKNGHLTIATIDPLAQSLIGSRMGLSHRDKLLANRMYPCIEKWLSNCNIATDPCQNDGYTGASCTCVCPPGTSGTHCETVTGGYYGSEASCSEKVTTEVTLSSPSTPTSDKCTKWIVAPECYKVKLTFSTFSLYRPSNCSYGPCCYWDFLEIRPSNLFDGDWYCGQSISAGESFTSAGNQMILYHKKATSSTGWSASILFVLDSTCTPTGTTTTTTTTTITTPTTTTTTTTTPTTTTTTTTTPTTTTTTPTTTTTSTPTTTTTITPTTTMTTTPPAGYHCHVNCYNGVFYWTSPNFPTGNYPNNADCGIGGSSVTPMMTVIKFQSFILQDKVRRKCVDWVKFTYPMSTNKTYCSTKTNKKFKLPYSYFKSGFHSDATINKPGFNISITFKKTSCHKLINLTSLGESGKFKTPRYPNPDRKAKRICELWIIAPSNYHVKLEFLGFDLRLPCKNNNLVVNKEGDRRYPSSTSTRHCGNTIPPTVVSTNNEIDLLYMAKTRNRGFKVKYTVVS